MASLQVNDATFQQGGQAALKIYGQLHRYLGSILNGDQSRQPSCLQIYIYDEEYQAQY